MPSDGDKKHPDCLQGPPSLTSRICCPQPWPICGVGKSRSRPDNKIDLKNDRGKARKSADIWPVAEIRAGELWTPRVTKPPRSRQPEGLLTYVPPSFIISNATHRNPFIPSSPSAFISTILTSGLLHFSWLCRLTSPHGNTPSSPGLTSQEHPSCP